MEFDGQVVIVTGGGSGIGRCVARRFGSLGATVVVCDRDGGAADAVRDELAKRGTDALAVTADVTDEQAVASLVGEAERFGDRIDVLVNSAGAGVGRDTLTMSRVEWEQDLALVLTGTFLCCRAVLPHMIARRIGAIVNITSANALTALGSDAHSAAKAGVVNLTRNLAVRHGPDGVRVNAVAPATVRTPAWTSSLERDPDLLERLARWYPLGRIGEPEDVAPAVTFLASREAAWITGVVLPVDGGITAGNTSLLTELET